MACGASRETSVPVLSVDAAGWVRREPMRENDTDHNDFITNDLHLWPSEMLQCNNRRQAGTIQHVS